MDLDKQIIIINSIIIIKIPKDILYVITGNILGDGSIGYSGRTRGQNPSGNARYKIGISIKVKNYMEYLRTVIYKDYCPSKISFYPNIALSQHRDKEIKLCYFQTGNIEVFTELHKLWYI